MPVCPPACSYTDMRLVTTFRSTTDRICDGGPIILYYIILYHIIYYIILYYIILYYIILYYIILYYIILYYTILPLCYSYLQYSVQ